MSHVTAATQSPSGVTLSLSISYLFHNLSRPSPSLLLNKTEFIPGPLFYSVLLSFMFKVVCSNESNLYKYI